MFGKAFIAMMMAAVVVTPAAAGNKGLMGALIGAGAGAAIGHAVDRTGGSGKGALIGAIGGYIIGSQMEKSEEDAARSAEARQTPPAARQDVASGTGDCSKARTYLDQATATPDHTEKVYLLEKAVRLCPADPRLHNDLGVAYYNRGQAHDRDRARDELKEALRLDPGYTIARDNLNSI